MSLVSLKTELRQDLKLTPQLLQSMEILQMNSQELLEYLNKVSEENPLVEQEDSPSLRSAYEELRQKAAGSTAGSMAAPSPTRTPPYRSGAPRTGRWKASPPSSATSWTAGTFPSPCWP